MASAPPLKVWIEGDGGVLRLRLARPKANIVDAEMIKALDQAFASHVGNADLRGVVLDAEGPHFSFGASVEEHLPAQCHAMLRSLHKLVLRMLDSPIPILVAVRGQCLGGGLEVALAGHLIFAAPNARMGQPEIKLGVIAPAASCLLPQRIGQARAQDLLFSGRSVDAQEALSMGLVNRVADDPVQAALDYVQKHLSPLSASSLRYAVSAAQSGVVRGIREKLDNVEALYLKELMATRDANEGLEAFIAKRPAVWENR